MNPGEQSPETPARYVGADRAGRIVCGLCPHACVLGEGQAGRCHIRAVHAGRLVALGYGRVASAAMDPIEKKPLYHFHPGIGIFSLGGWGCNFACRFCQNWTLSQCAPPPDADFVAPARAIAAAVGAGAPAVAYTYNEPIVGIEYVLDCAVAARAAGLLNVLVTNGYIQHGPATDLLAVTDALNVDIKSMDEAFYQELCGAALRPVLAFCRQCAAAERHLEITHLVIPGRNDRDEQVARLAEWIAGELGPAVVLHLSAYRPEYQYDAPPTTAERLEQLYAVARARLAHVYLGNCATATGRDTLCAGCGQLLVDRRAYRGRVIGLRKDDSGVTCSACGRPAPIRL